MLSCPPINNLLTCLLETLGTKIIAREKSESLVVLQRLVNKPFLSQFISQYFTPRVDEAPAFLAMYKIIGDITEREASMAFVLISKVS